MSCLDMTKDMDEEEQSQGIGGQTSDEGLDGQGERDPVKKGLEREKLQVAKKPEGDGRKRNRPYAGQQNAIDRLFIG